MWTALFMRVAIVGGLVAYAAWAYGAIGRGAPWWPFVLGLPLAYLALPFLFTSIWMYLGWRWRADAPAGVALSWAQRASVFLREFASIALSAPRMALYSTLLPDPAPARADLPVLLVHGVGCNAGVWYGMRGDLAARGIAPVYTISYGPPLASIDTFADQLAAKIDRILGETGARRVVLVCHSMGGLVARTYVRRYGGGKVARVIAIGAPFGGSRHAGLMFGTSLAQMRPGSTFLAGFDAEGDEFREVPFVSLWSWHDSMVTPQTSSRLVKGENIVISGVAHNALLNDRGVWARVAAEISKAQAASAESVDVPHASTFH